MSTALAVGLIVIALGIFALLGVSWYMGDDGKNDDPGPGNGLWLRRGNLGWLTQ
jgi:hypothetical protein